MNTSINIETRRHEVKENKIEIEETPIEATYRLYLEAFSLNKIDYDILHLIIGYLIGKPKFPEFKKPSETKKYYKEVYEKKKSHFENSLKINKCNIYALRYLIELPDLCRRFESPKDKENTNDPFVKEIRELKMKLSNIKEDIFSEIYILDIGLVPHLSYFSY